MKEITNFNYYERKIIMAFLLSDGIEINTHNTVIPIKIHEKNTRRNERWCR